MVIRNFGLFWERDEVQWNPGKGKRREFRLLGRTGSNRPGLRLADFRMQQGIYILYGNFGPYYVGLTRKQGLGKRLKDHLSDNHGDAWTRFSWFGFRQVLKQVDDDGISQLRELASIALGEPQKMIGDLEALLIKSMGLRNKQKMNFAKAEEWTQIELHEIERFLDKIAQ
jgi:hypothetical protein